MRRGIGRLRAGGSGFNPLSLFAAGEQGGWYDPSDLSSMFQDSAGTTPAAIESPVGKINDKSGRGNHLIQATAASRPTLSARYNRLLKSQVFADAAWTKQASVVATDNTTVAPDGTTTAATITWGAAAVATGIIQTITGAWTGVNNTKSIYVKADVAGGTVDLVDPAFTVGTSTLTLSTSWQKVSLAESGQTTAAGVWLRKTASTPATVYVWGGDLRTSADAALSIPAYQRVDTASSYDTSGFPMYLSFDGVDDSLSCTLAVAGSLPALADNFMAMSRTSTKGVAAYSTSGGGNYFGVWDSGAAGVTSSGSGTQTIFVDAVSVTDDRIALATALGVGANTVLEHRDAVLNVVGWSALATGNYSAFQAAERLYQWVLCPSQTAARRSQIRTFVGAKAGRTL